MIGQFGNEGVGPGGKKDLLTVTANWRKRNAPLVQLNQMIESVMCCCTSGGHRTQ